MKYKLNTVRYLRMTACPALELTIAITLSLAVLVGRTPIKSESALERDCYHR
jgi:hypothetical protein